MLTEEMRTLELRTAGRCVCAVQAFCRRRNLGGGRIHFRRAFESPKGFAGQWPAKPKKKDICFRRCLSFWQGVTIQILSGRLQFFLRSIQTAFWPAAPLRRTSVLPQAKPWRRANSLRPSISITEGWSDQRERNPKENATCRNKSHFLLERLMGVEPTYAAWEAAVLPMNYSRI